MKCEFNDVQIASLSWASVNNEWHYSHCVGDSAEDNDKEGHERDLTRPFFTCGPLKKLPLFLGLSATILRTRTI